MPIYTRAGDTGSTSLFGGKKVLKCEELVDVYGSIDELNSWVGLVISYINTTEVNQFLQLIQSDLLTIGGNMAGFKSDLSSLNQRITEMEKRIDIMEKELPPLSNFIIPGGSKPGAFIHIVRSICRRVERQAVALNQKQPIDPLIIKYLNRLSDLFFMLARFINKHEGCAEIVWKGSK
jgi:cob(I)alamin adenosyltransferase